MTVMHSVYKEAGSVWIDDSSCTRCGKCVEICAGEVLRMENGRIVPDPNSPFGCIACGHCMMVCPSHSVTVTGRGISPEDLLPLPPKSERATPAQLAALLFGRRSVRHFTDQEVSPEDIQFILEAAASAPMGIPPWDIGCVTVTGRENVRELAEEVVRGYAGFLKLFRPWVLEVLRPFYGRETYEQFLHFVRPLAESYVNNLREGRDTVFYDAPALLIFYHSPYADALDASIACTYAMLAAESLGLGNTMIGGAPPILQRNKALCRKLGIPENNKPSLVLILGHSSVMFRQGIRRHFTQVSPYPGSKA